MEDSLEDQQVFLLLILILCFTTRSRAALHPTIILEEAGNFDSPTLLIFIGYFGFLTRKTKLLATLNCFFESGY